jgi:hypothetical protein
MSDNAHDKGMGNTTDLTNEQGYYWKDFSITTQDSPSGYWDACYQSIAHVNQALEFIESKKENGVIPDSYLPYYGEALVLRAYCHFMLVNIWGKNYDPATAESDLGIPYVTEVENVVFKNYKRETVAKVYELVEKDLTEGIKYIQDDAYDVAKYHFNKAAANTFASRFYLYKGEWDKVEDYSTAALGANASTKLRDLTGKYATMGLNEQFAEYSKATDVANLLICSNVSIWFSYYQAALRYTYSQHIADQLYEDIFILGEKTWGQPMAGLGEGNPLIVKWGYFFKSNSINADVGIFYAMIPTIVAEEALFNRIEAYIMQEEFELAEADLNTYFKSRIIEYGEENVVTEAKIIERYENNSNADSPLQPWYELKPKVRTYLNCAIDSRRREFIYNGLRWFDIKRFNLKVIHKVEKGSDMVLKEKDPRKVLQIPESAQSFGLAPNIR